MIYKVPVYCFSDRNFFSLTESCFFVENRHKKNRFQQKIHILLLPFTPDFNGKVSVGIGRFPLSWIIEIQTLWSPCKYFFLNFI